ncbi:MAG TPA: ABC transporter permease [Candidatus Cloacimonadota bacterium]|nr:ABC transporter permease [Candidatus Cloacimonadota bacterium]HOH78135.1 ABC transporter permease [Candidatus Cloacimonadota bacterium]
MDYLLAAPTLLWLTIFFLVPYFIVFIYGFLTPDIFDVKFEFSLDAYRQIFNGTYFKPFFLSFRLALLTTMLCVLLGYPVAYFIARAGDKLKNTLLVLIIIPFWTNLIIRIFSWRIFLSYNGVLNDFLISTGLISQPLEIMRTDLAVILVMVYVYLPYMVLPLFSVLEKLDFTLLHAAMDLGANEVKAFFRVTLPLSVGGIFAGVLLVFIPALGAYLIPQLVGDQRSLYVGQVITYKIKNIPRNWPTASALSFTLLLLVAVCLLIGYSMYRNRQKARRF